MYELFIGSSVLCSGVVTFIRSLDWIRMRLNIVEQNVESEVVKIKEV